MASLPYRTGSSHSWSAQRPLQDPSVRRMKYGPIRPMHDDRSLIARLFNW